MPLNTALTGQVRTSDAVYEVSREKIREFALAVGERHPAHHDPAAARTLGHRDLLAPVTFLAVLVQRATDAVVEDPELGLDFSRVVHRDQRFVLHRPVYAGDRLRTAVHLDSVKNLAGSGLLELRCEIAEEGEEGEETAVGSGGRAVATVHMSLVSRAS